MGAAHALACCLAVAKTNISGDISILPTTVRALKTKLHSILKRMQQPGLVVPDSIYEAWFQGQGANIWRTDYLAFFVSIHIHEHHIQDFYVGVEGMEHELYYANMQLLAEGAGQIKFDTPAFNFTIVFAPAQDEQFGEGNVCQIAREDKPPGADHVSKKGKPGIVTLRRGYDIFDQAGDMVNPECMCLGIVLQAKEGIKIYNAKQATMLALKDRNETLRVIQNTADIESANTLLKDLLRRTPDHFHQIVMKQVLELTQNRLCDSIKRVSELQQQNLELSSKLGNTGVDDFETLEQQNIQDMFALQVDLNDGTSGIRRCAHCSTTMKNPKNRSKIDNEAYQVRLCAQCLTNIKAEITAGFGAK